MEPDSFLDADHVVRHRASGVGVLEHGDDPAWPKRRVFLQALAAQGVSIPASYLLFGDDARAATPNPNGPQTNANSSLKPTIAGQIIRDFSDPYIELIRLLHEASVIEHALMVQYLYAAFSIKPAYIAVMGYGVPSATDLLGVAIQEMQHLGKVNALLLALGAAPNLVREEFPYEPDIYPFEFQLEPLSRESLAKYVYAEAPAEALQRTQTTDAYEQAFLDLLDETLGKHRRLNHLGSLYANIIRVLKEHIALSRDEAGKLRAWIAELEAIKRQGEDDHFHFFKDVFLGTHAGFKGHANVWSLPPSDPAYPARSLPMNPSAVVGHQNQLKDPMVLSVAWLGNLHYWTILLLVDFGYRTEDAQFLDLAKQHMLGPFWAIARHLPTLGAGMPFDSLSTGYAPCDTNASRLKFLHCMAGEASKVTRKLKGRLPEGYPLSVVDETLSALSQKQTEYAAQAHAQLQRRRAAQPAQGR